MRLFHPRRHPPRATQWLGVSPPSGEHVASSLLRVAPSGRRPCRCWTHSRSSRRKTKRRAKRPSRTSGGQTLGASRDVGDTTPRNVFCFLSLCRKIREKTAPAAAYNRVPRAGLHPVSAVGSACQHVRNRAGCASEDGSVSVTAMIARASSMSDARQPSCRDPGRSIQPPSWHAAQKNSSPMPTILMFLAPRE